ncbi:MAG: class I SAM-dependent methyltransferase [Synergistales bacterium]
MVELDNPFTKTNRAAVIIGQLGLRPGMTILDAGCGPGRLTFPLAMELGPVGRVVAMDIQEGMLERVEKKADAHRLGNIRYLTGGIGEGKLGHDQFDRSLLVALLGEIPDREAALEELFLALKPGGILSVTEIIFDPHFQGCQTVLRLSRKAEFSGNGFFRTPVRLHAPPGKTVPPRASE